MPFAVILEHAVLKTGHKKHIFGPTLVSSTFHLLAKAAACVTSGCWQPLIYLAHSLREEILFSLTLFTSSASVSSGEIRAEILPQKISKSHWYLLGIFTVVKISPCFMNVMRVSFLLNFFIRLFSWTRAFKRFDLNLSKESQRVVLLVVFPSYFLFTQTSCALLPIYICQDTLTLDLFWSDGST